MRSTHKSTAAQTNITSVGTLSSLTVSGDLTVDTSTLKVDSTNNRVGIGTASPVYTLDVQGGRALHTDNSDVYAIGVRNRASLAPNGNYWIGATNATSPDMVFSNNAGTERMRLTDAGNLAVDTSTLYVDATNNRVGIGTASPGYALQVDGASTAGFVTPLVLKNPSTNAASATKIGFDGGGTVWGEIGVSYNTNSPYMAFFVRAGSEKMRLDDSGNLGLGVTPSAWQNTGSLDFVAMQLGNYGAFVSGRDGLSQIFVGANAYYDGTNWKYANTATASLYTQSAGSHAWLKEP